MEIEFIDIEKLSEDPNNARVHSEANLRAIKGSLAKFGQQKPIVVDKKNVVIAGNGTLRAAIQLGWEDIQVVRTELEGYEAMAFALADNKTAELAEWDIETLKKSLEELKLNEFETVDLGFMDDIDTDFLDGDGEKSSEGSEDEGDDNGQYSKKIEAPVYEPQKDEPPAISELADFSKRDELLKKIKKADLSKEQKDFLKAAANRHVGFDYEQIAEYYAHASKEMQELMEESALVIIDFDKAIENGFVQLSKDIEATYTSEELEGDSDEG